MKNGEVEEDQTTRSLHMIQLDRQIILGFVTYLCFVILVSLEWVETAAINGLQ